MGKDIYAVESINGEKGNEIAYVGGHSLKEFYDYINQADAYENNHGFFESTYTKEQWQILTMQFEAIADVNHYKHYSYNLFFQAIFDYFKNNDNDIIIYVV